MKMPQDPADWKLIAANFNEVWNFPNCIGAIDEKHVLMKAPDNSGLLFFKYKHTFSMILLALVDSSYRFIMVDVGAYGRNSNGGVLQTSQFGQAFADGRLNIPAPSALPGAPDQDEMPHVFVGDEAFPLQANLMRPYPGQPGRLPLEKANFNYRLSRARRVVENAFGILASRWRIYERRINLNEENTQKVVLATCILHNFLQTKSTPLPIPAIADEAAARLPKDSSPWEISGSAQETRLWPSAINLLLTSLIAMHCIGRNSMGNVD